MAEGLRLLLQVPFYAAFAVVIGWLSVMPPFRYAADDIASIKLSLSHATERVKPCVRLTPEEIAKLAPNMRHNLQCERERLPLLVEVEVDETRAVHVVAEPAGLWKDGPASVYERLDMAPGNHRITARLRDTAREEGWDYTHTEDVLLTPGRYFTITFKAETGGFHFR